MTTDQSCAIVLPAYNMILPISSTVARLVFCFRLLLLVALVTSLALVSVLVIAYIHTDQELTATLLAIVLFEADVAPDSV